MRSGCRVGAGFRAALAVVLGCLLSASPAPAQAKRRASARRLNPVIFVHGYDGSGAQFESQQERLTSNGYPSRYIAVLEYNSLPATPVPGQKGLNPTGIQTIEQSLFPELDQLILQMKSSTHRPKVELLAHSLGTKLMQDYLNSSKERAANVADYVNIDGQTANSLPGGVRTLALWGSKGPLSSNPGRKIRGARNVTIPDSTHVQCATSSLSFWWFYKFFTGRAPKTTQILPQKGTITIAGRALNFPVNNGLAGATVEVWTINQSTGQRTGSSPLASTVVGASGDWGPVKVHSGKRYELTLIRTDNPSAPTHHFYFEPFIRSDHLVRLLESDAIRSLGGAPDPRSVAMLILRYKELWGDQGSQSDVVTVNGQGVCNPTTCPLSKEVNGLFAADFNHDGQSEPTKTWPGYQNLGYFISSVDVFAPAAISPTGKVTVGLKSRGRGPVRRITFPNFAAPTDDVTVQFNDWDPGAKVKPQCGHRRGKRGAACRSRRAI